MPFSKTEPSANKKEKEKRSKKPPPPTPQWLVDAPPTEEAYLPIVYGTSDVDARPFQRMTCPGGCGTMLEADVYRVRYNLCNRCLSRPVKRRNS